jgi:hypothetical protein
MTEYQQSQQYQQQLTVGKIAEKFFAGMLEDRFSMKCVFPETDGVYPYDFTAIGRKESKTIEVKFDNTAIKHSKKRSDGAVNLFIEFFNPVGMYASKLPISEADLLAYILNEVSTCYLIDQKKLKQFIISKYRKKQKVYIGTNNTDTFGLGFLVNVDELKEKKLITEDWTIKWD